MENQTGRCGTSAVEEVCFCYSCYLSYAIPDTAVVDELRKRP